MKQEEIFQEVFSAPFGIQDQELGFQVIQNAIDVILNRNQFILAVSSESRIGILVKAAPYSTFPERLKHSANFRFKTLK